MGMVTAPVTREPTSLQQMGGSAVDHLGQRFQFNVQNLQIHEWLHI